MKRFLQERGRFDTASHLFYHAQSTGFGRSLSHFNMINLGGLCPAPKRQRGGGQTGAGLPIQYYVQGTPYQRAAKHAKLRAQVRGRFPMSADCQLVNHSGETENLEWNAIYGNNPLDQQSGRLVELESTQLAVCD
ncbi:hypothetical protein PAXRUDRAFT_629009 [Paxillus rubicundulus Ve08.2h10]|uniref:Uncharacterized protein n=1 Tax=Paxillus rubicundulus Ve08.2h10 TaxID=930991 RepID=A0A0D0D4L5_9AGAM|nr:hypothetical protein PAXRUDRAFT_629009 [Paxillus rubicundulus Ve08.2h10]